MVVYSYFVIVTKLWSILLVVGKGGECKPAMSILIGCW